MKSKNLILILARGGSNDLSRQNLRLIDNKPLLYYVLDKALKNNTCDVYVSTDSKEISELTLMYGGKVIPRPDEFTRDCSLFHKIAYHALLYLKKQNLSYKKCLVLSPMFPLIKQNTINNFFNSLNSDIQTIFGVVKEDENFHKINNSKNLLKLSNKETKVVKTKKIFSFNCENFIKNKNLGKPFYGITLDNKEVFTIHDYHDYDILEKIIQRRRILVRVDGNYTIGLGHVFNMLTVLNQFRKDDILIVMNSKKKLGNQHFKNNLYKVSYFSNSLGFFKILNKFKPHIIINDILNTSLEYTKKLKKTGCFVVNFEDLGPGKKFADLVFNPIYHSNKKSKNEYFGHKYACVRDEFRIWKKPPLQKKVSQLLITFGGSDPNNLTCKSLQIISNSNLKKIHIIVLMGFGNLHVKKIKKLIHKMRQNGFTFTIVEKSSFLAKYMINADFIISSNGRTIFEIAALKIPFISISANTREEKHLFSIYSGGGIHLGLYSKLKPKLFLDAIEQMMNYDTRKKFANNLEKFDITNGTNRIVQIIDQHYDQFLNS